MDKTGAGHGHVHEFFVTEGEKFQIDDTGTNESAENKNKLLKLSML